MIRDISNNLIDLFETNIEIYLTQIDSEVSDVTPVPKNITSGPTKNMYPEIFIDVNNLEYEYRTLQSKPNRIYTVEITIMLRTSEKDKIEGWCSNYIEAIYRMLEEKKISATIQQYLERVDIIDLNIKDNTFNKAVVMILRIEEQGD